MNWRIVLTAAAALLALRYGSAWSAPDAGALYQAHCASCHGADRLGGTGPALLPDNLARLRKPAAVSTIADGRIATQMPAFKDKLNGDEIKALAELIYTPLAAMPSWGMPEIRASRIEHRMAASLGDKPVFKADPLNLFVVVELGDHHATILDGDKLEPITRFPTRYALHGGPKFSPDGRFVYFASRDGWIAKYDIWNLTLVAEIRAGINTRNLAVSSDGRFVMVANYLPHTLVALDARDLQPVKVIDVKDGEGKSSRVSAVYDAAPRKSFVAALKDIPEVWELTYDDKAEPVYNGMVHDYKMGEGVAVSGPFPPRRIILDDYLDDFFFDARYDHLIGSSREGKGQVVNLNIRRKITNIDLPGMPHLGSGITWELDGRPVMASPNLKEGLVTVIDMKTWKTVKQVPTLGPGFFMRSHENVRHAWVDVFNGSKDRDVIQILDKNTLEVVAQLRPSPGKVAAHTEFSRDGKYALVSVWEDPGELVVYDAQTLKEVKRLPMRKPSGKYNVHNKITRSAGTSH
ncbi:MAG TPA: cytochrome D1 domain-containing protein [Noviherbaspirillum sp.]|uniref:cytochrome D1 domain-containing protein n=1 Tax=Noviherbaspirillum sp. TaxID=1926288 RepID=UPI002D5D4EAE|nr:cytochrome D1 domain-containing protein [Noviherbaspirillum sp.]HYD93897.1 cytochrome D1 domain-containing protein [Noviherbaspirillum sp.]